MKLKILYEDDNLLVIDKPAGTIVFPEQPIKEKTLIDHLLEEFPYLENIGEFPRYGIIHRLDKDTSGILLVAKNNEALKFFQKQFKESEVTKEYIALVIGNIKTNQGKIDTLIGRSKNGLKQRVFFPHEPGTEGKKLRRAVSEYKVKKRFKNYTLLEIIPKTGRKHQIRCHLSYLSHPIAGDKLYGFKNQPVPEGLDRQFLHATFLKIRLQNGKEQEFKSPLSKDLENVLDKLDHD
jgi:23S rRNA pseudouridine1911/1915/1917 synthase